MILLAVEEMILREVAPAEDVARVVQSSFETDTVPRRFELPWGEHTESLG